MKNNQYYRSRSYWLEECNQEIKRQKLNGSVTVDVAILGGGFTGLWTAYYLLKENPSLNVAILEKEVVGFGASARNGGWCSPKFAVSAPMLIKKYGLDATKNLNRLMIESVEEIEHVINKNNFDVDWKMAGSLKVAIGKHLVPNLEAEMEVNHKLGLDQYYEFLTKEETDQRVRINNLQGSILTKPSAVVHPAKLVNELANLVESLGGIIYEQSKVTDIIEGDVRNPAKLVTDNGIVEAKQAVVVGGEAFVSQFNRYSRRIIPMYTSIVLTEPLSEEKWEEIGWKNRETVGSNHLSVDYLQRTKDNRILFGLGNSSPYRYASKMDDSFDTFGPSLDLQRRRAMQWFDLKPEQFTHSWGGPIGVTRDWTPNIRFNKQTKIVEAWGYAGQGVSTTNLAARIVRDLLTDKKSDALSFPAINHTSTKWEPEPFRWIGAKYIKYKMNKLDDKSEKMGIAPKGTTIAERLIKH